MSLHRKGTFCAAGENLSVWDTSGKMLAKFSRSDEEGNHNLNLFTLL